MALKVSYSHARDNLADVWDMVEDSREAAVIQRRGHEDMALIPAEDRPPRTRSDGTVLRDPYQGLGKPEHLEHLGGNVWSRRINEADRLVYEVFDDRVEFLQARYHY